MSIRAGADGVVGRGCPPRERAAGTGDGTGVRDTVGPGTGPGVAGAVSRAFFPAELSERIRNGLDISGIPGQIGGELLSACLFYQTGQTLFG